MFPRFGLIGTNLSYPTGRIVSFYNGRDCRGSHKFVANQVMLVATGMRIAFAMERVRQFPHRL